jgi:beta-lactamase regulating signal transducer with metallopeptidase domain
MHPAAHIADIQMMATAASAWAASAWQAFGQKAAGVLVTSIWQGAMIVCTLEIATRLMPRVSAGYRFVVWAVGFGIAAALPFLPLFHFVSNSDSAPFSSSTLVSSASHPLLQVDARWALIIAAIWVVASLARAAALVVHSFRLRRLWKASVPVNVNESLTAALNGLRSGRIAICTTEMLDRPSAIGFLAPRVLIPKWLMDRVTSAELEQIVLHEAEHLRRRDDWTNLLQKLMLVAFPINPALAWMEQRLCREREIACDEGVVRITHAPRAYAACLASLAERRLEQRAEALSLGAWHRRSELVHRVHRILLRKPHVSRTTAGALVGAVGCVLIAGSMEMARCPQVIAFVPKQNELAMTPARQQQLAALLAHENAEARLALPAGYHAVQARASMPSIPHAPRHANLKPSSQPKTPAPTEQLAEADRAGDRVTTSDGQQWVVLAAWEEVRTVANQPAIRASQPTASNSFRDYDVTDDAHTPAESVSPTEGPTSNAAAKPQTGSVPDQSPVPVHQFTVTQLILRVVPANQDSNSKNPNTKSTQPPAWSARGGWFVIQL